MKPILRNSLLALAGITFSAMAAKASDDFVDGDLCIAFYQTDAATDSVVQPNTYVVNLGQASLYRENTQNGVAVSAINTSLASSSIGADLVATFGSDWAQSGTVRWCVVGGVQPAGTVTAGDPTRTTYFSRSRSSFAAGATGAASTIATPSSSNIGNMSTAIRSFFSGSNDSIAHLFGTSTSGVNLASTILPIANTNSVDDFLPPAKNVFFEQGIDPRQAFAAGALSGGGGVEGALDLYRILFSVSGADLTVGATAGNAVARVPVFIGALTIDASGNLKIQGIGAAATANYSTWAATNNVTGGPNGDSDNDGISNLVEYALALNPAASDGAPGTYSGGTLSFAKRAVAVSNGDVTYAIQESDDLGVSDPWQTVTPTTNTPSAITYTLPAGGQKKFARLSLTTAP